MAPVRSLGAVFVVADRSVSRRLATHTGLYFELAVPVEAGRPCERPVRLVAGEPPTPDFLEEAGYDLI
ncbi:hypothetical protein [Coriobacterium glomerans]|uniref:hypothetical protein n=1 Tax=Coriobacterium glomerans TaxID=33871 RepID=UPI00155AA7D7|nr:hypothetical protein [Coriobacterium glomerans]